MINPFIAIIHNLKENRWHPVIFDERPLPSGAAMRHKSLGHHAEGFASREEALININDDISPKIREHYGFAPTLAMDDDFPWDGEGVPAIVTFFVKNSEGKWLFI